MVGWHMAGIGPAPLWGPRHVPIRKHGAGPPGWDIPQPWLHPSAGTGPGVTAGCRRCRGDAVVSNPWHIV